MSLSKTTSRHNYKSFLFHAAFLAFAQNFMDIDTVIPSMIVEAGGGAVHIGIMTAKKKIPPANWQQKKMLQKYIRKTVAKVSGENFV